MHIDAITLAAVADEWRTLLRAARIDNIISPTERAIAIQCYAPGAQGQSGQNYWLYLSAHPQFARAHLTARKPTKIASEPSSFVMLLRKHLEGARIESIVQPRWERMLEIIISHRVGPDSEERIRNRLVLEIMGRVSNIILCDEYGRILGSLKHVSAEMNRYRVIAPNVQYVPPPPQQRSFAGQILLRLEPTTIEAAQIEMLAQTSESTEPTLQVEEERVSQRDMPSARSKKARTAEQTKLWQLLSRNLLGFSPLLASEAIYRTTGNTDIGIPLHQGEALWEELARNVRELAALYDTHSWSPQLVERVEENSSQPLPVAFAPYALQQYAQTPGMSVRQSPSINVLIDDYYAGMEWRDAMESVRAPIRRVLQTQRERCLRKAELLRQELAITEEADRYRAQAELLLAYQHEVPRGPSSVTLPNFFADEGEGNLAEVIIPLDPRFDAVGNANRLFHRYSKLRRALSLVPGQIEQNAAELATIEQLLTDLALAETPAEVALVKAEVQAAGYIRGTHKDIGGRRVAQQTGSSKGSQKKSSKDKQIRGKAVAPGGGVPLYLQSSDGFTLLIGKNSRQNEEVTFHQASANDIWLHVRGVPGAHVIIKAGGRNIPQSTIQQAARLAAYYSSARESRRVPVDYTLQRYVRHMKGGGPGMVIYERERTIYAEPGSSPDS